MKQIGKSAFVTGQVNVTQMASVIGVSLRANRQPTPEETAEIMQKVVLAVQLSGTEVRIDFVNNSVLICIRLVGALMQSSLRRIMRQVRQAIVALRIAKITKVCETFPPVRFSGRAL